MWVLFGILSGSSLFGIWGMVIAMPLLVSAKITFQVYKENHQNEKLMEWYAAAYHFCLNLKVIYIIVCTGW